MGRAAFSYAQARLHARLAARLTETQWQHLESGRDLAHCLETLGRTPAAPVTRRLARDSDVHAVERALRAAYAETAGQIAGWLPPAWRPAVDWFRRLPFLTRHAFVATGEARPGWFAAEPGVDANAPEDAAPAEIALGWRAGWADRMPDPRRHAALVTALAPFLDRYLGNGAPPRAGEVEAERQRLAAHLLRVFRARPQTPAAVFAFLGLAALDLERLRGILAERALFAGVA